MLFDDINRPFHPRESVARAIGAVLSSSRSTVSVNSSFFVTSADLNRLRQFYIDVLATTGL